MKLYLTLTLLAWRAVLFAQDVPLRVFVSGNAIVACTVSGTANAPINCQYLWGNVKLEFAPYNNQVILRSALDNLDRRMQPAQFLDKTGVAYGSSLAAAQAAWDQHVIAAAEAGVVGSVASEPEPYTLTTTISLTNVSGFSVYNPSLTTPTTYQYGKATFNLNPDGLWEWSERRDPSSGKIIPLPPSLTVPGTTTVPIVVTLYRKQP